MRKQYDILIKNTTIIDGTGKEAFKGDIGIKDEKIIALGNINGKGEKEIDGAGLITCPGFVDSHSHADMTIYKYPEAFNLIMQGITTFVGGNCGMSLAPVKNVEYAEIEKNRFGFDLSLKWKSFNEWLNCVDEKGLALNYIPLVGHSAVRGAVLGKDNKRESTRDEIEEIKNLVEEAFESGAFGVSTMFDPDPGPFHASRHELVEVVKIAKKYNGVFSPHCRHHQNQWPVERKEDEGYGLFCGPKGEIITGRYHGLLESVEVSKSAGNVKLHIAHLTPAYIIPQPHPKILDEALAKATLEDIVDKAKSEGLDISYNVLPCEYSIGSQLSIIDEFIDKSPWKGSINNEEFIRKLKDKDFIKSIGNIVNSGKFKFSIINPGTDPYWFDCFKIINCKNKEYEGKVLGEIIRDRYNKNIIDMVYIESINVLCDILQEDSSATWALVKDKREYGVLETFLKHPLGIPATDTTQLMPVSFDKNSKKYWQSRFIGVSPLSYGMFVHFLRTMVKEKKVLSLEEAIMKITSFPAQKVFEITDRGVIKEGAYADIVMIDFENLKENEDFKTPQKTPEGIVYVFVNGKMVCEKNIYIGIKAGKVLRNKKRADF